MSAGLDGSEGGRGCVWKASPCSVASVSFSTASVDKTALASWALAEVSQGLGRAVFHLCMFARALPAVLNASLTLFCLLFSSRTLLTHTSSRKPSLPLSSDQVPPLGPHSHSHSRLSSSISECPPSPLMSLSVVVWFSMSCVSSSGPGTKGTEQMSD